MNPAEFPHSEIPGSKDVCSSPKLIAAYHVFRRLPVPRHSPCALCSLTVVYLSININFSDSPFANKIFPMFRKFFRQGKFSETSRAALAAPLLVKLYLQFYHGFNILLLISCFAVLYSVFKVHPVLSHRLSIRDFWVTHTRQPRGGLKWTRTIDLSVISRVL